MRFEETDKIQYGSRIVRPIYNKDGVLLYGSGTKVDAQVLVQLKKLDVFGIYLLDEQEAPIDLTDEEIQFESFQTMQAYVVEEILREVFKDDNAPKKLDEFSEMLVRRFGYTKAPIYFNQSLRSKEDYLSKHALDVAMLTALITGKLNRADLKERIYLVQAALFYDIGRYLAPRDLVTKTGALTGEELKTVRAAMQQGYALVKSNYKYPAGVRRYLIQLSKDLEIRLKEQEGGEHEDQELLEGTKILKVASMYDTLTAVRPYRRPQSPFSAYKYLLGEYREYDEKVVEALGESIHILPSGSYVQLTNGEQGIVIRENPKALQRPTVLGFETNTIYDLSINSVYQRLRVEDTVFTPDNRPKVQQELANQVIQQMGVK